MALSLSNCLITVLLFFFSSLPPIYAATVPFDFHLTWVRANPDGLFERPVIGINDQWPIPAINITLGDRLIVNVFNDLGNQSASLHFHGLFQNGTTDMDGAVGVSQCGIPPGSNFTYDFVIDQPGNYWYHSHARGQYPDGLRGPVYVNDPKSPYLGQYDEEIGLTLSDWYHEEMVPLLASFLSVDNPTGAEPVPDSALMSDTFDYQTIVEPGKTYFLRLVNMGAFAGQFFWIDGLNMTIISVDGCYTERQEVGMIYLGVAQRYGLLVTIPEDTTAANYAMIGSMDEALFDVVPPTLNPNATGWLVIDDTKPKVQPTILQEFNPYDDQYLKSQDQQPVFENPTQRLEITMMMADLGNGFNYAFINNATYVTPKVPTLYTVLSSGGLANNQEIYGPNTNTFMLEHNQVFELILNNDDTGTHPFHLHGHEFQVIYRAPPNAGFFDPVNNELNVSIPQTPVRRDTFVVKPESHWIVRFRSDNPGVWLFHCHIEWHTDSGLIATFIEAPMELQQQFGNYPTNSFSAEGAEINFNGSVADRPIPENHLMACQAGNTPYVGNAAGNTENFLDLQGVPRSFAPLPSGFTTRGIVALVFSCVAAFLGMGVIAWYGAQPIGASEEKRMKARVNRIAHEAAPTHASQPMTSVSNASSNSS